MEFGFLSLSGSALALRGATIALTVTVAACTSVSDIVTSGGFIYTDPPSSYNTIGSILIVQKSLRSGNNVLTEVCANSLFDKGVGDGSIKIANGEEQSLIKQLGVDSKIDVTPNAATLGRLLSGSAVQGSVSALNKSELTLSNVSYYTSSPFYIESIAPIIGATPQCGTTPGADSLKFLRDHNIKAYFVYKTLTADVTVSHTFDASASVEVKAAIENVINADLSAKGVLNNQDKRTGRNLNIGYRLYDPSCPNTRIDKIPTASEINSCN